MVCALQMPLGRRIQHVPTYHEHASMDNVVRYLYDYVLPSLRSCLNELSQGNNEDINSGRRGGPELGKHMKKFGDGADDRPQMLSHQPSLVSGILRGHSMLERTSDVVRIV